MDEVKKLLKELLDKMLIDAEIEELAIVENPVLNIKSPDSAILIGKQARNLRDLEFVFRKILEKSGVETKFILDVNEYRLKRLKEIEQKARENASTARKEKRSVKMSGLNAFERMIVHSVIGLEPDLETKSEDTEEGRVLSINYLGL